MRPKLSVVLPVKDEASNIRQCIESVRSVADEIVVADSGSSDNTIELARAAGCRVVEREFISFSSFKNWAIQQAENEWVLTLDADERLTPQLTGEISKLFANEPTADGYRIRRRNHFCGRPLLHGPAGNDLPLRLFKRSLASYNDVRVHESVSLATGNVAELENAMHHYSDWSVAEYFERFNGYTSLAAEMLAEQGKKATWSRLLLAAPVKFFKGYILQRGFLDGKVGLISCSLAAVYAFAKYAKLWSMGSGHQGAAAQPTANSQAVAKRAA